MHKEVGRVRGGQVEHPVARERDRPRARRVLHEARDDGRDHAQAHAPSVARYASGVLPPHRLPSLLGGHPPDNKRHNGPLHRQPGEGAG